MPQTEEELKHDLERGRIYRLNDKFFKFAFGRPERKALFLDLINSIIFPNADGAFVDITFIDREFSPLRVKGKECRLDIVGTLDGGEQINVEVQVRNDGDYEKRSVCNWSIVHFSQFESGMMYVDAKKTITINILAFDLLREEPDFRNSYSIKNDKSGNRLCDDLIIIYLEIPKYRRAKRQPINKLERWMAYLAGMEGEEMSQIAEKEPMIGTAIDVEKMFLMNHKQRLAYVLSWKEMMDEGNRQRRHQLEQEKMAKTKEQLEQTQEQLGQTKEQLGQTQEQLGQTKEQLGQTKEQLGQTKEQLGQTKEQLEQTKEQLEQAKEQAEQAQKQAERTKAVDTARNLLAMGLTVKNIADATGLEEEDVRELKRGNSE